MFELLTFIVGMLEAFVPFMMLITFVAFVGLIDDLTDGMDIPRGTRKERVKKSAKIFLVTFSILVGSIASFYYLHVYANCIPNHIPLRGFSCPGGSE